MPMKSFRRQTHRVALLLSALSLSFLVAALCSPLPSPNSQAMKRSPEPRAVDQNQYRRAVAKAALMKLPISFEPGSDDQPNQFFVRGSGYRLLLTAAQTTIATSARARQKLLMMTLLGANAGAHAAALDPLPGKRNYLIGADPARWRIDVPAYSKVRYDEIYPGISVLYYGQRDRLEYDFRIAPGADPRAIKFAF